ncbi:MAG: hypothetical protein LBH22_07455 [Bacteroidales bacterium]|jgi:hypothetical protein|nr:hypothetical protein [Bacteroidales bacterium]
MKKTISLSLALLLCTILHAEIKKNSLITVTRSRDLAGAIQPLPAGQTFSFKLPQKLHFYTRNITPPGGTFNSLYTSPNRMSAKEDNRNPADFQFTIVTNGIENLSEPKIVSQSASTRVVEYTYTFPVKMELHNKDGELLKTFILSPEDKVYKTTVAPNFLEDVKMNTPSIASNTGGSAKPQQQAAPTAFRQNEDVLKWIKTNEAKILARMEYDELRKMSKLACEVIPAGYGFPRVAAFPTIYGLDKKDIAKFPELNEAIEKLKSEVERMFTKEFLSQELEEQLMKSGDFFASQYTSESPKAMIQLCAMNAGFAYLLAGDTEKAIQHLQAANKALPVLRGFPTAMFEQVSFMNQLRKNQDIINVSPPQGLPK